MGVLLEMRPLVSIAHRLGGNTAGRRLPAGFQQLMRTFFWFFCCIALFAEAG
jgi:hypothetical protein